MQPGRTQELDKELFRGSLMSSSSVVLEVKLMFFNLPQILSLLAQSFQKQIFYLLDKTKKLLTMVSQALCDLPPNCSLTHSFGFIEPDRVLGMILDH